MGSDNTSGGRPKRRSMFANLNLRTLFVSAFMFGAIPIAVTAATNDLALVLVFGVALPLFCLIAYWAIGQHSRQASEQQESFADSVYYLGFLLTLGSLLAALFSLRGERPELGMLASRFGLALTTTIFGLLIRVTIVNFERDIDDEEKRARESLTKGVDQFQAEMDRLSDQLQLVLSEVAQRTRELAGETVDLAKEQLSDLSRQSEESHKELAAAQSKMIVETTTRLNESVTLTHDSMLSSFRDANRAMRTANNELLEETSSAMNQAVKNMHESLETTLRETNASIRSAAEGTATAFTALEKTPRTYQARTEENIKSLEEAQKNLNVIIAKQTEIASQMAEQSSSAVMISQKMNVAAAESAMHLKQLGGAGQQAEAAAQNIAACLTNLNSLGQSLQQFEESIKRGPGELASLLPNLRAAMEEITALSQSGEASLRQVQQNLIGATEDIVNKLGKS